MNRWNCLFLIACHSLMVSVAFSQHDSRDREIVQRSTSSVWADIDAERPTNSGVSTRWVDVSDRHQSVATPTNWQRPAWLQSIHDFIGNIFEVIFYSWMYILLFAAVLIVGTVLYFVFRDTFQLSYFSQRRSKKASLAFESAKIQDLPFPLEQSPVGLYEQALRWREAGDYSRAIIYLFSHVLVELDGARCIRLERGKTNRGYLREIRDIGTIKSFTGKTIQAFEYSFFGKHPLSRDQFEMLWSQLPDFQRDIQAASTAPATLSSAKVAGAN